MFILCFYACVNVEHSFHLKLTSFLSISLHAFYLILIKPSLTYECFKITLLSVDFTKQHIVFCILVIFTLPQVKFL